MSKNFYITTTLPYVNAEPHIGFALEIIRADVVARFHTLIGDNIFFNTGTDEHGMKIYEKAKEVNEDTQTYVNRYAATFKKLIKELDLHPQINFIRTTDEHHKLSAQEFWRRCDKAGDIYKKTYAVKYCVGCELEKTDSELVDGKCPLHPKQNIELINEENYFFRFSKYGKKLLDFYKSQPDFVIPDFRFNEIKAFVERGLEDFSISRLKSKMPWGVPVPNDSEHVMYVWFDALVNYISAIGWPDKMDEFNKWWPVTQYAGKDNLRQQSAMWQAMLMSAEISPSAKIIINGFITGEGGVKMSKSIGNVISPFTFIDEYGTDALRLFLIKELSSFEDSPVSPQIFKIAYNANLANGYGNLASRILKMANMNGVKFSDRAPEFKDLAIKHTEFIEGFNNYDLQKSANFIWKKISDLERFISIEEPFKKIKTDKESGLKDIVYLLSELMAISTLLLPFIPKSSGIIIDAIKSGNAIDVPLFPRK